MIGTSTEDVKVVEKNGFKIAHHHHGIGGSCLSARVFNNSPAIMKGNALAVEVNEIIHGTFQSTNGGRRYSANKDLAERQLEQRGCVNSIAPGCSA